MLKQDVQGFLELGWCVFQESGRERAQEGQLWLGGGIKGGGPGRIPGESLEEECRARKESQMSLHWQPR